MLPSGCPGCNRDGHDHEGKACPNWGSPIIEQMLVDHESSLDLIYQRAVAFYLDLTKKS